METRPDQSHQVPSEKRPPTSISVRQRVTSTFGFHRISGVYLLIIIIITFGIWVPDLFLTQATLHSVFSSQAVIAILAVGAIAPLSTGVIDISIGANANLAAIVVTIMQNDHGWPMWPAIGFAILVSLAIGAANGTLIVKLGINPIIATLAMTSIIAASQTIIVGSIPPFPVQNQAFSDIAQREILGFQSVVMYLFILAFVAWWALEYTPVGRYVRAVGANPEAARLSGVSVGRWTMISVLISATFAGIAGVLFSSQVGPSLTFGPSLLLPALAATFLGSTQILPGRFNVWGTVLAVYVLATGVKGLQLVTGAIWLPDMFNGVALITAVGFGVWQVRRTLESRRKHAAGQVPASSDPEPNDQQVAEPQ